MNVRWHPAGARGRLKALVAERVRERVDGDALRSASAAERRVRVAEEALEVLNDHRVVLPAQDVTRLVNEISDEVVGLGPIEGLLKDPEVTEVMCEVPPCQLTDLGFMEKVAQLSVETSPALEGEADNGERPDASGGIAGLVRKCDVSRVHRLIMHPD